MAIKWGTDSKVEFMEPTYQFPIKIGACGEMNLRAEDKKAFCKRSRHGKLFDTKQAYTIIPSIFNDKNKNLLGKKHT